MTRLSTLAAAALLTSTITCAQNSFPVGQTYDSLAQNEKSHYVNWLDLKAHTLSAGLSTNRIIDPMQTVFKQRRLDPLARITQVLGIELSVEVRDLITELSHMTGPNGYFNEWRKLISGYDFLRDRYMMARIEANNPGAYDLFKAYSITLSLKIFPFDGDGP
jgi:hypothetical protein